MIGNNHGRTGRIPEYSFSDEHISLDPDFPVFMFSFSVSHDPIRNLHCHDVLELGLCLKGNGIFIIGNAIQPYEAGDVIAIGPEVYHRAKSGAGMEDLWYFLYFNPEDWEAPANTPGIGKLVGHGEDAGLSLLMTMLTDEIRDRLPDCKTGIRGLIITIMVLISRLERASVEDTMRRDSLPQVIDERINKAMDIMISAENHQLGIRELANRCNLSEPHFRHLFKEQVGMSPKHFKTKLQINMAMNMLKDKDLRVVDISEECGFESLSSLNRLFKKETGFAPLQWRTRQQK